MDCIEQQGSSWNNGGIITEISPIQTTIDSGIDKLELELNVFL